MRRILAFFLASLFAFVLEAQTINRQRQLTMDNGLPSNSVRCVTQDKRGFIWIGTDNGLCRFDGLSFQIHLPFETTGNQMITAMVNYGDNNLAVGTSHGAFFFDIVTEQFTPVAVEADTIVTGLSVDRDGNLWISTDGKGVVCVDSDGATLRSYAMNEAGGRVNVLYADNDNQTWVITSGKSQEMWHLDKSTDTFVPLFSANAAHADGVSVLLQTSDGRRWAGTAENGLLLIGNDGVSEPMSLFAAGHCQHIHALFELSSNQLLIGADDGLWLFDTNKQTYTLYQPSRFVMTIARDHEGGLWVGTSFGGVGYLSPISHRFDGNSDGPANCICEDRRGCLWVGSEDGLRCYQNGRLVTGLSNHSSLRNLRVHSLCMDDDNLWIGTFSDGVIVFSTVTGKITRYGAVEGNKNSLYDPNSCTIYRDKNGIIWVATIEGLCQYDRKNNRFNRVVKHVSDPMDIDMDAQGNLWISTHGKGIWQYSHDGKKKIYRYDSNNENSLSDDMVNCLFIDAKGQLWAGTQGGLCLYDPKSDAFSRIDLNVPQLSVSAIIEDQNVFWISSDRGILRYEQGKNTQRFAHQDGLESEQFQPNSVAKSNDGCIYFGTGTGFSSFYPYKIKVNEQSSPVFITQFEIYNQPVNVGSWRLPKILSEVEQIDLWNADNVFSLSFASLSYCSPSKNMYAYILEGFDKKWNYVGHEHKATYTNLPAGKYIFRVKATNNDGVWSDQEARLVIEIHPPFWWSTSAKIFYVVFAIAIIWLLIQLRLRQIERRHHREMEQLNEAKQEEMRYARTEFFTTIAHEIRTPVSLIIGPLEKIKEQVKKLKLNNDESFMAQIDVVDRNAHRLLELVNQLLDFRKVEQNQQDVNFAPQNISELMQSVAKNFETVFKSHGHQFVKVYPDSNFTAVVDRECMVKLLSNLLSNANKYTHDTIGMKCRVDDDGKHFTIDISDNGYGISKEDQARVFNPFFQAKDRKPGTGIGLSIVKKIVELHHGVITVKSELGRGTTFSVQLPVAQAFSGDQAPEVEAQKQAPKSAEAVEPVEAEKRPSMLIVDDNEDMLTFLVTTFMDKFEVTSARDGKEAIELLEESLIVKDGQEPSSTFDIIISDWMMAEMDGPELCNRMRQNAATAHIPFILLTAKTDSQSKVEAMRAGVDAFIEKPFAVKYLEACIHNLLKRQRQL